MSTTFGVPGYTLELWSPFAFAGASLEKPAEFFRKPDEAVIHRMLDAFAKEPGAIVEWKPFDHPQLGEVEIGGIEYQTTVRNPPERLLKEECGRGFTVADRVRRALPLVRTEVHTTKLADGVARVELLLENVGFLPTSGLRHAESIGTAPPVHVDADGLELLEGLRHQDMGWLDGWGSLQVTAARHPIYPGLPQERGARTRAAWVVKGAGTLTLRWDAGRGGRGVVDVEL
jgi:hypothetical protein